MTRWLSMAILLTTFGRPVASVAGPDSGNDAPSPLVQPEVSAARVVRSQTELGSLDGSDNLDAWIIAQRVAVDWALTGSLALAAALPFAYGNERIYTDPTFEYSDALIGNPSFIGRWRMIPVDGDSRIELAASSGIIIPTAREEEPIREAARRLHIVHRPYDFEYVVAVPVRADARWTHGSTAVQAGIAVHTVIDHGDPELDMILATAGVGHRLASSLELLGDLSVLAMPPGDYSAGLDAGLGKRIAGFDLRLRLYLPSLPGFDSGHALGFDVGRRFE